MNRIQKYPLVIEDIIKGKKKTEHETMILQRLLDHINAAYYAGFAHAIISTPEEAACITPLQISMYKLMAEENNKYLRGVSEKYIDLKEAYNLAAGSAQE